MDRVKLLAILVGLKVAYDNDVDTIKTGEKLYRPAVKLSKWTFGRTEVNIYRTLSLLKVGTVEKAKSLSDL